MISLTELELSTKNIINYHWKKGTLGRNKLVSLDYKSESLHRERIRYALLAFYFISIHFFLYVRLAINYGATARLWNC